MASRTRVRNSRAAASVKVMAAILAHPLVKPLLSDDVFPLPAPASTNSVRSSSPVMTSRAP